MKTRPRVALALAAAVIALGLSCWGCGAGEFDGELAHELVVEQCAFGPRVPGSEGHERMLAWLIETLDTQADQVALQSFEATMWESTRVTLTNVIASFRKDARRRVLLCAHWDTRAVAERDPDPANRRSPIPGANDGASGVAVLMELARMMATKPPRVGVDIVLFDGEDGGNSGGLGDFCIGSAYYARHMGGYSPVYAVVVDMIGDRDLSIPVEPNSMSASPEIVDLVWDAAEAVGADSFTRASGAALFDDHIPLLRAGVPATLVIDFDYAYWHTLQDSPDKVSGESLKEVGDVLVRLIY